MEIKEDCKCINKKNKIARNMGSNFFTYLDIEHEIYLELEVIYTSLVFALSLCWHFWVSMFHVLITKSLWIMHIYTYINHIWILFSCFYVFSCFYGESCCKRHGDFMLEWNILMLKMCFFSSLFFLAVYSMKILKVFLRQHASPSYWE